MKLDHIALESSNIKRSVDWYCNKWNAKIVYQDKSWAVISINGTKIAFVTKGHHPPHIGFNVSDKFLKENLIDNEIKIHRDGSKYLYLKDPDENVIEILNWNSIID